MATLAGNEDHVIDSDQIAEIVVDGKVMRIVDSAFFDYEVGRLITAVIVIGDSLPRERAGFEGPFGIILYTDSDGDSVESARAICAQSSSPQTVKAPLGVIEDIADAIAGELTDKQIQFV